MAVSAKLEAFLRDARVKYTVAKHAVAYTAQEIAASQHVSGKSLAKSVLVKTNRGLALAVLPAAQRIALPKLKRALRATQLSIGREADIKTAFPDVEIGAMSPFGQLYSVPVVVERSLAQGPQIVFNAGSHTDTITMDTQEFLRLAKPTVGVFGEAPKGNDKKKKKAKKNAKTKGKTPGRRPARKTSRKSRRR